MPNLARAARGDDELERFPPSIGQEKKVVIDEKAAVGGLVRVVPAVEVQAQAPAIGVGPVFRRSCVCHVLLVGRATRFDTLLEK